MVDVGDKTTTERTAVASATVRMSTALIEAIREGNVAKGQVLEVARIAGIQAAKRTSELIPLCHGLPLSWVDVEAALHDSHLQLWATAKTRAQTGVEMEALTAVTVAALTVIDMGKAIDRHMVITDVKLLAKSGGRHDFDVRRPASTSAATTGTADPEK